MTEHLSVKSQRRFVLPNTDIHKRELIYLSSIGFVNTFPMRRKHL